MTPIATESSLPSSMVSQVQTLGALGYSLNRIASLLKLTKRQSMELKVRMDIPEDEFRLAYERGRSIGEYNIDCQLQKQAESGDIESASLLEERVEKRKIRKLREDLFGI